MQQTQDQPRTDWPAGRITAEVKLRGKTMKDLATEAGLPSWACQIAAAKRHPPGEIAIAEFLDRPVWEIWPSRWRPPQTEGGKQIRIDNRRRTEADAA